MSDNAAPAPAMQDRKQAMATELDAAAAASQAPELALRFAALSAKFLPEDALVASGLAATIATAPPPILRVAAVAQLADACDARIWHPEWIMRASARARLLGGMTDKSAELADWRLKQVPLDDTSREICEALVGRGSFAPSAIDTALADPALTVATCEKLLRGLTFAQPVAPASNRLDAIRAAMALIKSQADPDVKLIESGCFGRVAEIAKLETFITERTTPRGMTAPFALAYVGGIGGVGKSTLLAEVRNRQRAAGTICLLLDFDRPGIEGGDRLGLSREIARQVAETVGAPGAELYRDIAAASVESGEKGPSKISLSGDLLDKVGAVLVAADRPVLLSLDTLEALTWRGDSAANGLVDWLGQFNLVVLKLAVIAAGRETLPQAIADLATTVPLAGLPDPAARQFLLKAFKLEGPAADSLIAFAKGNPLVLRLGAKVLEADGGRKALAELPADAEAHIKAGLLYRLILSRIPDEDLKAIAHPGLLLRQINAQLLIDVVAPEVGLAVADLVQAQDLLNRLKAHAWLVQEHDGWLLHRSDLRPVLLDAQLCENPQRTKRIFASAAEWHGRNGPAVLALYYRLQAMRWSKRKVPIDFEAARQLSSDMIAELPQSAQNLVALARGERSTRYRAEDVEMAGASAPTKKAAPPKPDRFDIGAAEELRMVLERHDFAEAAAMIGRARDFSAIDLTTPVGGSVIEALWRYGDWPRARKLLASRGKAMGENWLGGWDNANLLPAMADLDPLGMRTVLRSESPACAAVLELTREMGARADWEQVCLLLQAEGHEHRNALVHVVFDAWCGEPMTPEAIAKACHSLDYSSQDEGAPSFLELCVLFQHDRLHGEMAQNRLQTVPGQRLEMLGLLAEATLKAAGQKGLGKRSGSFAIDEINNCGLLAEYLTALTVFRPGLGLQHLALAAQQRSSTVAGYWCYGEPPKGWRPSATDWFTALALGRYVGATQDNAALATAEITRWQRGYDTEAAWMFLPLVKRSQDLAHAARLPLVGTDSSTMGQIAQILIDSGVPLQLAPPLAILAPGNSPLNPIPQQGEPYRRPPPARS